MNDYDEFWTDDEQSERAQDPKVDEAKIALEDFFEEHLENVFYERQLEVIFENKFFHWITSKALYELRTEGRLASDLQPLSTKTSIRFYRSNTHRFWKRQALQTKKLVLQFSNPTFTRALGNHGELLFDAALPVEEFMPRAKDVREFAGKRWTLTAHDLDRVFERDGIFYGTEIKNTLSYITQDELRTKLDMCSFFGIRPLFIVRMAPKSYIQTVRLRGGFTLIFKFQLYPHGAASLAKSVRESLNMPVDSPTRIAEGTIKRFLNWHLKTLSPPTNQPT